MRLHVTVLGRGPGYDSWEILMVLIARHPSHRCSLRGSGTNWVLEYVHANRKSLSALKKRIPSKSSPLSASKCIHT